MKKCSLIMAALLALSAIPVGSFAADQQADVIVTVYPSPLSTTLDSVLSVSVSRQDAKTVYTDAEFLSSTPAKIKVSADESAIVAYTLPALLTLAKSGGGTAEIELACRSKADVYPTSKTDGEACGTEKTITSTKKLNFAIFPTKITFPGGFVPGEFSNTLTMSVNYQ